MVPFVVRSEQSSRDLQPTSLWDSDDMEMSFLGEFSCLAGAAILQPFGMWPQV